MELVRANVPADKLFDLPTLKVTLTRLFPHLHSGQATFRGRPLPTRPKQRRGGRTVYQTEEDEGGSNDSPAGSGSQQHQSEHSETQSGEEAEEEEHDDEEQLQSTYLAELEALKISFDGAPDEELDPQVLQDLEDAATTLHDAVQALEVVRVHRRH